MNVRVRNVSGHPASLPLPYNGTLPPGGSVIIADTMPSVASKLGAAAGPVFSLAIVPDGNVPTASAIEAVGPEAISHKDASGLTIGEIINRTFVAGVGGGADDIVIYDGNAPHKLVLEDIVLAVTTNQGGATATIRDAKAGGGNALSSDLDCSTVAKQWDAGSDIHSILPGGTLVLRRSDNRVAGELIVHVVKVP